MRITHPVEPPHSLPPLSYFPDPILAVLANALTEAASPGAFLVVMAVNFAVTFCVGWVACRIPIFRYIPLILWGLHAYKYPTVMILWEMPVFYLFWGLIAAYALFYRKKYLRWREMNPRQMTMQINSPRAVRRREKQLRKMFNPQPSRFARFFRACWKGICDITYFFFIFMPVRIIRLCFWLSHMLPRLKTARGWWQLLIGLLQWLWYLFPFPLRYEFEKHKHGKDFNHAYGDELKSVLESEQNKRRKREEDELRRAFFKAKRYFKKAAQSGKDPFDEFQQQGREKQEQKTRNERQQRESQQQSSDSNKDSNAFWENTRKNTQANSSSSSSSSSSRYRRSEQPSGNSSNTSSKKASGNHSKQDTSSDDFWRSQASQNSQGSAGKKTSAKSTQSSQSTSSKKPPHSSTPKNHPPTSKAFYNQHAGDFKTAGWTYSSDEERYTGGKDAYTVLNTSSANTTAEIKKAYRLLAKKYMGFTNPCHPTPVQARANAVLAEINSAKDKLLKK